MISKTLLVMGLCIVLNLQAESVFFDKKIYKTHTDKKGTHKIYAETYTIKYDSNETIKRIKKIKSYLNGNLEWSVEDNYYLTKTISKYSLIDDFDKDGINDIILVYGFSIFSPSKTKEPETYVDFELAVVYKNQVAKIVHDADADDCFRYTEVDKQFYTFPKTVIDKTIKTIEKIESIHHIPIVYDFKKQMRNKNGYLWEYDSCGKVYPWKNNIYGYVDLDHKRKVKLYEDFTSLSDYCKKSGIKENEIRALNPWINKEATNIPTDAEIVVPILKRKNS